MDEDYTRTGLAQHDALVAALRAQGTTRLFGPVLGTLTLYEGHSLFEWPAEGGQVRSKLVSAATLAQAFSGQPWDTGWLPPGTVRWGAGTAGAFGVCFFPPQVHRLPFVLVGREADDATWLDVPLPALVFAGQGRHYWLWAVPGSTFDPAAPAYVPPLPNVQEHGSICFGPTNPPPDCTAESFGAAWALFGAAPFNDHVAGQKSQAYPNDVRAQLELLAQAGATAYPFADLVGPYQLPFGRGDATVADLVAHTCRPEGDQ